MQIRSISLASYGTSRMVFVCGCVHYCCADIPDKFLHCMMRSNRCLVQKKNVRKILMLFFRPFLPSCHSLCIVGNVFVVDMIINGLFICINRSFLGIIFSGGTFWLSNENDEKHQQKT